MTRSLLLAAGLCLAATAAQALHVCTDASGRRSYQDQPCSLPPPRVVHAPLTAQELTPRAVQETVRRFHAALSDRDATSASRLLGSGFTSVIQTGERRSAYTRAMFTTMVERVVTAASMYSAQARCQAPVAAGAQYSVTCEVHERMTLLNKPHESRSTESFRIGLEDGQVKLLELSSVQHARS